MVLGRSGASANNPSSVLVPPTSAASSTPLLCGNLQIWKFGNLLMWPGMSFGVRDIRNLYPRITENHLRYLEKWGLIRPAPVRGDGEFTFAEVATIKQLAAELEKSVPLRQA